jgi:hypothetical protein
MAWCSGEKHRYNFTNIIREVEFGGGGHVAFIEVIRNVYNILVGKPEGKRRFGRHRRRWEDRISVDLKEIG